MLLEHQLLTLKISDQKKKNEVFIFLLYELYFRVSKDTKQILSLEKNFTN